MKQVTKRLRQGDDLRKEIEALVKERAIKAGCIVSLAGSLTKAALRMADGKTVKYLKGPLEIVSATGTVSSGGCHIHISISDNQGATCGGHLKEGCIIKTTAEVVLLAFSDIRYKRVRDETTGRYSIPSSSFRRLLRCSGRAQRTYRTAISQHRLSGDRCGDRSDLH